MWKSIVLCVSLFGSAAAGLIVGARFEPAVLPAAAAVGLCLIGVVLILVAPTSGVPVADDGAVAPTAVDEPAPRALAERTSPMPVEALQRP